MQKSRRSISRRVILEERSFDLSFIGGSGSQNVSRNDYVIETSKQHLMSQAAKITWHFCIFHIPLK